MTDTPLIPRKILFGNADKASVQLSPDGTKIAWLAPLDGVMNIWVAPRDAPQAAKPLTHDTAQGIRYFYCWAHTNTHILYFQDQNGDMNWRYYSVDLRTEAVVCLVPFEGVQAQLGAISPKLPEEILICANKRDPHWHDTYRVNIITGEISLIQENDRFLRHAFDDDYQMRWAVLMKPDGALEILKPAGDGEWKPWDTIPAEDAMTTMGAGIDWAKGIMLWKDTRDRNTAALVAQDLQTGKRTTLAEDPRVDVQGVLIHPTLKHPQAVSFALERTRWQILDPAIEADFAYLGTVAAGDFDVVSRSLDDQWWVVQYVMDDGPVRFYLYDQSQRAAQFLFTNSAQFENQPLAKMHPVVIKSRDGLDLVSYYTLPLGSDSKGDGIPDHPLPLVIMPHGGPWGRDSWGLNPLHQWLANRGYVTLAMNFRASMGFGKDFLNAGNMEWGGKIIDDQMDAVQWAVDAGIADPKRLAIFGGSFGGYSALMLLGLYPEVFACAIDLVGPSNLITFLEALRPQWVSMIQMLTTRMGDHRTEEGRALLTKHSPMTYADRICRPLLIGQGANDPQVKQAESDRIVKVLEEKGVPVTYLLYPDEGHGLTRPENMISFIAVAESFLAKHLGGRCEAIGDDFEGASVKVMAGERY